MGQGPVPTGSPRPFMSLSLFSRSLKDKLIVAFSLMSVIPLLVLVYLVTTYVFPSTQQVGNISLTVMLAIGIALLGLAVTRSFVMPMVKLASQAQAIAHGKLDQQVEIEGRDEVGAIGLALNQITQRVRDNMAQLREYGEQTKQLNLDIHQRVLTLSHLLQVSNLISQSAKIDEVQTFILEKMAQIAETELNCLLEVGKGEEFTVRVCVGSDRDQVQALQGTRFSSSWLRKVLQRGRVVVADQGRETSPAREFLEKQFGIRNAVLQPVISMKQEVAVLLSGNRKPGFSFREDLLDLLKVFGQQVGIAVENDLLIRRADQLKVIDELTGLYNASYMKNRLVEEVSRAVRYHRPCSLVLLDIDDFENTKKIYGPLAAEGVLHQVAELLKGQMTDVDRAGRMGPDEFAIILPERNKREAIELAEIIRTRVEQHRFSNGPDFLTCSFHLCAGVSENPLDGSTAEELFSKAEAAMRSAKQQGKNKVIVA